MSQLIHSLSYLSTAFKIWRTVKLPILNKEFKVYDLSRSLDSTLREAYCAGIVDVYKPHLVGQKGYYYDVNSLYPTAMCQPKNEYIGLLPVKWQGKLVCPGVTLTDLEGHFNTFPLRPA